MEGPRAQSEARRRAEGEASREDTPSLMWGNVYRMLHTVLLSRIFFCNFTCKSAHFDAFRVVFEGAHNQVKKMADDRLRTKLVKAVEIVKKCAEKVAYVSERREQ